MTFIKINTLLHDAFERIDQSSALKEKQGEKKIEEILKRVCPFQESRDSVVYKNGVLTILSPSQVMKQKIHLSKEKITTLFSKEMPHLKVSSIVFKGPRQ